MPKRQLQGRVVSDKMDKTIVVSVERWQTHPRYGRRYRAHSKYKAHDEQNTYKEGDSVLIEEVKPLSKDKRWRVVAKG